MVEVNRDDSQVFALEDRFADLVREYKSTNHGDNAVEDFKPIVRVIKDLQFVYGRTVSQAEAIALEASSLFSKYLGIGKTEEIACDYVVLWVLMKELEMDLVRLFNEERPIQEILKIAEFNLNIYLEKIQLDEFKKDVFPLGERVMLTGVADNMPASKIVKDYLGTIRKELSKLTRTLH